MMKTPGLLKQVRPDGTVTALTSKDRQELLASFGADGNRRFFVLIEISIDWSQIIYSCLYI